MQASWYRDSANLFSGRERCIKYGNAAQNCRASFVEFAPQKVFKRKKGIQNILRCNFEPLTPVYCMMLTLKNIYVSERANSL